MGKGLILVDALKKTWKQAIQKMSLHKTQDKFYLDLVKVALENQASNPGMDSLEAATYAVLDVYEVGEDRQIIDYTIDIVVGGMRK